MKSRGTSSKKKKTKDSFPFSYQQTSHQLNLPFLISFIERMILSMIFIDYHLHSLMINRSVSPFLLSFLLQPNLPSQFNERFMGLGEERWKKGGNAPFPCSFLLFTQLIVSLIIPFPSHFLSNSSFVNWSLIDGNPPGRRMRSITISIACTSTSMDPTISPSRSLLIYDLFSSISYILAERWKGRITP